MSTIGGPGGIGGPTGPQGPGEADGADAIDGEVAVEDARGADATDATGATTSTAATSATSGAADVDTLAAELAAGRLTPREAIDRLVDATAGPELDATERAELRELLTELVASDPYLTGLAGRV
jgi:hypothetical protein